jgi:hypothetical protein
LLGADVLPSCASLFLASGFFGAWASFNLGAVVLLGRLKEMNQILVTKLH